MSSTLCNLWSDMGGGIFSIFYRHCMQTPRASKPETVEEISFELDLSTPFNEDQIPGETLACRRLDSRLGSSGTIEGKNFEYWLTNWKKYSLQLYTRLESYYNYFTISKKKLLNFFQRTHLSSCLLYSLLQSIRFLSKISFQYRSTKLLFLHSRFQL